MSHPSPGHIRWMSLSIYLQFLRSMWGYGGKRRQAKDLVLLFAHFYWCHIWTAKRNSKKWVWQMFLLLEFPMFRLRVRFHRSNIQNFKFLMSTNSLCGVRLVAPTIDCWKLPEHICFLPRVVWEPSVHSVGFEGRPTGKHEFQRPKRAACNVSHRFCTKSQVCGVRSVDATF